MCEIELIFKAYSQIDKSNICSLPFLHGAFLPLV